MSTWNVSLQRGCYQSSRRFPERNELKRSFCTVCACMPLAGMFSFRIQDLACFVLQFYDSSQVRIFIVFPFNESFTVCFCCSLIYIFFKCSVRFPLTLLMQTTTSSSKSCFSWCLLSLSRQFLLNENFLSCRILLSLLAEKFGGRKQHCTIYFSWNLMHTLHIANYIYMRRGSSQ